jgi:hypothetical protein
MRELMALGRRSDLNTTQYCVVDVNLSDMCFDLSQSKLRTAYHLSNGRQSAKVLCVPFVGTVLAGF